MDLFKKKISVYAGGDDPDTPTEGFCSKCKKMHTLPLKDWVLIERFGKINLACIDSVQASKGEAKLLAQIEESSLLSKEDIDEGADGREFNTYNIEELTEPISPKIGDLITFTLDDKTRASARLVSQDINKDTTTFMFETTFGDAQPAATIGGKTGWYKSMAQRSLSYLMFLLMPTYLQDMIRPQVSVQTIRGQILSKKDLLWLPTKKQIFGGKDEFDECREQFEYFRDGASTIKTSINGKPLRYWLRTPDKKDVSKLLCVNEEGKCCTLKSGSAWYFPCFTIKGTSEIDFRGKYRIKE